VLQTRSALGAFFGFTSTVAIVFHSPAFLADQARVAKHVVDTVAAAPHVGFLEGECVGVRDLTLPAVVRPFEIEEVVCAAHDCLLPPVCAPAKRASITTHSVALSSAVSMDELFPEEEAHVGRLLPEL
jgi:hypothetical protein